MFSKFKPDYTSDKQSTKCLCPRCKKIHYRLIFWLGKLPARKYCKYCESKQGKCSSGFRI